MSEKGKGVYNVVVIGAGTAGLVTAAGTAGLGGRVALVERHQMGGDCLNFGCVPSKALIASARAIQNIREAEKWGLARQEPQFDFRAVFDRMRASRARIAPNDSQERFESLGVDVFRGEGRFLSPREVQVNGVTLRAKHFLIAAGSRAAIPEVPGLAQVPYFTNETIFDRLETKPKSLIVLGGGPIGCELSQVFCRLGVSVTLVQHNAQLLPKEDADAAVLVQKQLEHEGIAVLLNRQTTRAGLAAGQPQIEIHNRTTGQTTTLIADALLVAAGRIPNVETLGLKAAGVKIGRRGIEVNDYLQTSQAHIYAAGDITGHYQFTHTADFQARAVVRNILMPLQLLRQKMDYSVVPWCTYTAPEVARVGLNEREAKAKNIAHDLFHLPMAEVDRAVVTAEDAGFVKVLVAQGTDKILGVTLVSDHAGDLVHEFVLAMKHGIGLGKIAATIHAYPTFAELARKVGDRYSKTRLSPRVHSVFKWLYARQRTS